MEQFGYFPVQSFWHKADPRGKIILSLAVMIAGILINNLAVIFLLAMILALYYTAKLPLRLLLAGLFKFKWLLLMTFLASSLSMWEFKHFWPPGFLRAITITLKLGLILAIALWINLVTKPAILIDGLRKFCQPLRLLKIPLGDFTLIMTLVLRYIPEILLDIENIQIAQKIRGVSGKTAILVRIKSFFIPLLLVNFRKAASLALAMSVRGYRPGEPRSSMEELVLKKSDYWVIAISSLWLLFFIIKVR